MGGLWAGSTGEWWTTSPGSLLLENFPRHWYDHRPVRLPSRRVLSAAHWTFKGLKTAGSRCGGGGAVWTRFLDPIPCYKGLL